MRRTRHGTAGFTLIELLVATAVFMILVGALTAYFVSSSRGYRTTETVSDRQQEVSAAVNLMAYDLQLAGYRGTTPTDLARTFTGSTVVVTKAVGGGASDRLDVQYFEDSRHLYGADDTCGSPCTVTYGVQNDASGQPYLYRQEGSAAARGIVQSVEHFKVLQYIRRDGSLVDAAAGTPVPDDLGGLNIEIAFATGGLWRFPVGVSNDQVIE